MTRLWPDTLVGRTVVVLLLGVVISNLVGLIVYSGERFDLLLSARGRAIAERVGDAARVLEETPAERRRMVVRSLRALALRLSWSRRPVVESGRDDWHTRVVRRALTSELGEGIGEGLRLTYWNPAGGRPFPALELLRSRFGTGEPPPRLRRREMRRAVLFGSLPLADGSWLNFGVPLAVFRPFWTTRFFMVVAATTLVALIASVWAVRRASKPLSMFAAAADRLGLDVNAPPVPVSGPHEVRLASRAFNEMQRRLQSFIRDRTQMLAAISHDLRTPLTRMRLRAEFIDDAEQRSKMLADLDEMEAMIAATLSFARDDVAHEPLQVLDLAQFVSGVCKDAAAGGSAVSYQGPDQLTFKGRRSALKRLFANLIDNAVRYGTTVSVRLSPGARSLTVCVEDDGPGLPAGELERAFEPFHRAERSRSRETGGVGLGLAIVRSAARAHGGEVTLANRSEGGLRATVTLPTTTG